jgi:hypothetical protein
LRYDLTLIESWGYCAVLSLIAQPLVFEQDPENEVSLTIAGLLIAVNSVIISLPLFKFLFWSKLKRSITIPRSAALSKDAWIAVIETLGFQVVDRIYEFSINSDLKFLRKDLGMGKYADEVEAVFKAHLQSDDDEVDKTTSADHSWRFVQKLKTVLSSFTNSANLNTNVPVNTQTSTT